MKKLDYLLIGVQKGGTTACVTNFNKHKEIFLFSKEIHYFDSDKNYENYNYKNLIQIKCPNNYNKYIEKLKTKSFFGEKTPSYMCFKKSINRIYNYNPNIKLIIILREPISRAWSHFNMNLNKQNKTNNENENILFKKKIKENIHLNSGLLDNFIDEISKIDYFMLQRGFYIEQIQYILSKFKRKQIHISISEEILENPSKEYNKIFNFLGADINNNIYNYTTTAYKTNYKKKEMTKENFIYLHDIYKPYNEQLYKLLGRRIDKWETKYKKILNN